MTTIVIDQTDKWIVELVDDGTMETVIQYHRDGEEEWSHARVDADTAADYRDSDGTMSAQGLRRLFREVVLG